MISHVATNRSSSVVGVYHNVPSGSQIYRPLALWFSQPARQTSAAPRRASSRRFAASFCFRSSPAKSRHSAMFFTRASRAQHLRHQNRVRFVEPAGAGIEFSPQKKHESSTIIQWTSTERDSGTRHMREFLFARVTVGIKCGYAEVVLRFTSNVIARHVIYSWPELNSPTCSPRSTFQDTRRT
jgi:hypothetical protein